MKTRLPKTLLLAVLAAMSVSTAYANTTTKVMKPFDIIEVDADTTADDVTLTQLQVESKGGYAAIVKDGQGTLTIKNNAKLTTRLLYVKVKPSLQMVLLLIVHRPVILC